MCWLQLRMPVLSWAFLCFVWKRVQQIYQSKPIATSHIFILLNENEDGSILLFFFLYLKVQYEGTALKTVFRIPAEVNSQHWDISFSLFLNYILIIFFFQLFLEVCELLASQQQLASPGTEDLMGSSYPRLVFCAYLLGEAVSCRVQQKRTEGNLNSKLMFCTYTRQHFQYKEKGLLNSGICFYGKCGPAEKKGYDCFVE